MLSISQKGIGAHDNQLKSDFDRTIDNEETEVLDHSHNNNSTISDETIDQVAPLQPGETAIGNSHHLSDDTEDLIRGLARENEERGPYYETNMDDTHHNNAPKFSQESNEPESQEQLPIFSQPSKTDYNVTVPSSQEDATAVVGDTGTHLSQEPAEAQMDTDTDADDEPEAFPFASASRSHEPSFFQTVLLPTLDEIDALITHPETISASTAVPILQSVKQKLFEAYDRSEMYQTRLKFLEMSTLETTNRAEVETHLFQVDRAKLRSKVVYMNESNEKLMMNSRNIKNLKRTVTEKDQEIAKQRGLAREQQAKLKEMSAQMTKLQGKMGRYKVMKQQLQALKKKNLKRPREEEDEEDDTEDKGDSLPKMRPFVAHRFPPLIPAPQQKQEKQREEQDKSEGYEYPPSRNNGSSLLDTLGMLASQVLTEEEEHQRRVKEKEREEKEEEQKLERERELEAERELQETIQKEREQQEAERQRVEDQQNQKLQKDQEQLILQQQQQQQQQQLQQQQELERSMSPQPPHPQSNQLPPMNPGHFQPHLHQPPPPMPHQHQLPMQHLPPHPNQEMYYNQHQPYPFPPPAQQHYHQHQLPPHGSHGPPPPAPQYHEYPPHQYQHPPPPLSLQQQQPLLQQPANQHMPPHVQQQQQQQQQQHSPSPQPPQQPQPGPLQNQQPQIQGPQLQQEPQQQQDQEAPQQQSGESAQEQPKKPYQLQSQNSVFGMNGTTMQTT